MEIPNQKITRQVSPHWDAILRILAEEKLMFGELKLTFHNGEPVDWEIDKCGHTKPTIKDIHSPHI